MAINSCDAHALFVSGDIEDANINDFIMQYDVKMDSKFPFEEYRLDSVNKSVASQVQDKLTNCSLDAQKIGIGP